MSKPDIANKMQEEEEQARMECEPEPSETIAREKAKQVFIEKTRLELESEKKLASMQLNDKKHA